MRLPLAIFALASLAVADTGSAQEAEESAAEEGAPAAESYAGVVPGEAELSPGAARSGRRPAISWIGFQPKGGGAARVFVQLSGETDYDQRIEANTLRVWVPGAEIANKNARRPLVTRFFSTAVASVDARETRRRGARGVELTIRFVAPEDAASADASIAAEKDSFTYLYLDFSPPRARAPADDRAGE